jgi:hypothetical protein
LPSAFPPANASRKATQVERPRTRRTPKRDAPRHRSNAPRRGGDRTRLWRRLQADPPSDDAVAAATPRAERAATRRNLRAHMRALRSLRRKPPAPATPRGLLPVGVRARASRCGRRRRQEERPDGPTLRRRVLTATYGVVTTTSTSRFFLSRRVCPPAPSDRTPECLPIVLCVLCGHRRSVACAPAHVCLCASGEPRRPRPCRRWI